MCVCVFGVLFVRKRDNFEMLNEYFPENVGSSGAGRIEGEGSVPVARILKMGSFFRIKSKPKTSQVHDRGKEKLDKGWKRHIKKN